ncbi:hypothetical protein CPC16_001888 [Podila verticillata]|uniref:Uncharacterized protein n=1 Tax=Podila verticillata NRRL 6337 TaxID=1069443 RepID=A0A086TJK3_9FUNG|nr:hypothetical protein BGZ52_005227 [Haplosporangium bisporale]KAF9373351.1 hypothetical protein CPC16_001888 [Podila verticillata]KFH62130.1 hypothetical protein MVEG_11769 [Podila verticillata NRRL 6337]
MIFAKLIAPIALLLTVSAAGWESVCVDGDKALLLSNNSYQDAVCLTIPLSQARDQWGGGRSGCNAGTYQVYWNIASDGQTWLCYGRMSACKAIKANQDQRLAESKGYDNCWSAQV